MLIFNLISYNTVCNTNTTTNANEIKALTRIESEILITVNIVHNISVQFFKYCSHTEVVVARVFFPLFFCVCIFMRTKVVEVILLVFVCVLHMLIFHQMVSLYLSLCLNHSLLCLNHSLLCLYHSLLCLFLSLVSITLCYVSKTLCYVSITLCYVSISLCYVFSFSFLSLSVPKSVLLSVMSLYLSLFCLYLSLLCLLHFLFCLYHLCLSVMSLSLNYVFISLRYKQRPSLYTVLLPMSTTNATRAQHVIHCYHYV